MPSLLRPAALFAFVSTLTVMSMPGCSQQGEGERCDSAKTGNADCNSGLTCVPKSELLEKTADRCCPADGTQTDSRCDRVGPGSTNGGSTGSAGAPAGGEASGGTPGEAAAGIGGAPAPSTGGMSGAPSGGAPVGGVGPAGAGGAG
jgi:hypothetical protein